MTTQENLIIDTSEYEEGQKTYIKTEPTTRGIMLASFANIQGATCHETRTPIKAGERFIKHNNLFFGSLSKTYQEHAQNAGWHDWGV